MVARKTNLVEQDGCRLKVIHLDRVSQARKEAPQEQEIERMSLVFKAMGDPNRLRILTALMGGEMCVCDIAAYTGMSDSAVSHSLRRLRDLALIKARRDGQMLYYSLDDSHVAGQLQMALDHLRHT